MKAKYFFLRVSFFNFSMSARALRGDLCPRKKLDSMEDQSCIISLLGGCLLAILNLTTVEVETMQDETVLEIASTGRLAEVRLSV